MNYKRIYDEIVIRAKNEIRDGYLEKHHILPRCLGGSDDVENLVSLTAREHFICHYILTKIYKKNSSEWYKVNHAFHMMGCKDSFQFRYFNSLLYEYTREARSQSISFAQQGNKNSQFGSMWITNGIENRKIKFNDLIPRGWIKGRKNVHSDEIRLKISNKTKGKSTFKDTLWINNGIENKRISVNDEIPFNFIKGRINTHTIESKEKIRQFNLNKGRLAQLDRASPF